MVVFVGNSTRLKHSDVAISALSIGCDCESLLAIMQAESNNCGFDDQNRPKILFEPYLYYRLLPIRLRATAIRQGLAAVKAGDIRYVGTSQANYNRLNLAMIIDQDAALKACSWGIGQVLGENHELVGYRTVEEMVDAAVSGEAAQLAMMVAFLKANDLKSALQRHDWASVARAYNGPNYAKHRYDEKLARYYAAWCAKGREPSLTGGASAPPKAHRISI